MSKEVSKVEQGKLVLKNLGELLDALCFGIVAGFAVYTGIANRESNWHKVLLVAGVVVSLQAFLLLVKHLSKK